MEIGCALPTGMEGLMYPPPFTTPKVIVRVAVEAEKLGYDHVWGNEHFTTQHYVRKEWPAPPNYYDPLISLSFCAAATTKLRLATCITVLPVHDPVILAKQVTSLDRFCGGRFILGVGTGAYREEFEAVKPQWARTAKRAEIMDEALEALKRLLYEEKASFSGRFFEFRDVELAPKALQNPLPIYVGGNAPAVVRRAAKFGQGWLPAGISAESLRKGVETLRELAREEGRDPAQIAIAPQFLACIHRDDGEAIEKFRRSQVYKHAVSLSASTLRGQGPETILANNLVGSPATIKEKMKRCVEAGTTCFAGIIFTAFDLNDLLEQMRIFAGEVMPAFK